MCIIIFFGKNKSIHGKKIISIDEKKEQFLKLKKPIKLKF